MRSLEINTWKLGYVGLAALDTALAGSARPRAHRLRLLTKPLLMPALAAPRLVSPRAPGSRLRTATLAAQALSWGG